MLKLSGRKMKFDILNPYSSCQPKYNKKKQKNCFEISRNLAADFFRRRSGFQINRKF